MLPGTGKVSSTLPTRAVLKKDKIYAWCSCGYSGNQVLLNNRFVISCSFNLNHLFGSDIVKDVELWNSLEEIFCVYCD